MKNKQQLIIHMYRWIGLKYGCFSGVFIGLLICLFEPAMFGEIYITLPVVVAGSVVSLGLMGYLFYPLLKSSLIPGSGEPSDKEIMDFYSDRSYFRGGGAEFSSMGGDFGSGDGGTGGD